MLAKRKQNAYEFIMDMNAVKKEILEEAKSLSNVLSQHKTRLALPALLPLKLNQLPTQSATPISHVAKKVHYKHLAQNSDREFIVSAYRCLLRHDPDPQGEFMYVERLRSGMSKAEVLVRLRYSAEGKVHAVHIRGLFWPSFIAFLLKIPILRYVISFLSSLVSLPRKLRHLETDYVILKDHMIENERKVEKKVNDGLLRINELLHRNS